jgi:hypothetical protein
MYVATLDPNGTNQVAAHKIPTVRHCNPAKCAQDVIFGDRHVIFLRSGDALTGRKSGKGKGCGLNREKAPKH